MNSDINNNAEIYRELLNTFNILDQRFGVEEFISLFNKMNPNKINDIIYILIVQVLTNSKNFKMDEIQNFMQRFEMNAYIPSEINSIIKDLLYINSSRIELKNKGEKIDLGFPMYK
jgi:hypothetical protein